jgi:hypothetical protein
MHIPTTSGYLVDLALVLVAISYGSLTLYDLLALRTIGRNDVPYRIAVLASFTSYPIAHASEQLLLWRRSFAIGFILPTPHVFDWRISASFKTCRLAANYDRNL